MSFGQQGPPASQKQVAYLKALLEKEGFATLREARHTYGLTQRQSGGKFTTREASELIDRLLGNEPAGESEAGSARSTQPDVEDQVLATQAAVARGFRADVLADELRRRGWTVDEPA
jgi:hypothetical protein